MPFFGFCASTTPLRNIIAAGNNAVAIGLCRAVTERSSTAKRIANGKILPLFHKNFSWPGMGIGKNGEKGANGEGWRWLLPRLLASLIFAFLLDNRLVGCAFFLGLAAVLPQLIEAAFSFPRAAIAAFLAGLILDSTHASVPFGFHAFFAIGGLFFLRIAHRHLNLNIWPRPMAMGAILTTLHHLLLSLAVPNAAPFSVLCSGIASLFFNTLILALVLPRPRKRIASQLFLT
ncbi:MAG: hypothetical protein LBP65_03490 [Puniceicoccales bacterium]|jgi:hypothetical protein|nr:hypothetical protein [Puniceicoccales bacterium]